MVRHVILADDDEDDSFMLMEAINEVVHDIGVKFFTSGLEAMKYMRNPDVKIPDYI